MKDESVQTQRFFDEKGFCPKKLFDFVCPNKDHPSLTYFKQKMEEKLGNDFLMDGEVSDLNYPFMPQFFSEGKYQVSLVYVETEKHPKECSDYLLAKKANLVYLQTLARICLDKLESLPRYTWIFVIPEKPIKNVDGYDEIFPYLQIIPKLEDRREVRLRHAEPGCLLGGDRAFLMIQEAA